MKERPAHNSVQITAFVLTGPQGGGRSVGKGIVLWLLGIPIPLIILILLFWH
jgi:hypothetical protein